MMKVYEDGKLLVRILVISFFVETFIGYSIFQAHKIISGPQIALASPQNGETTHKSDVDISGIAKNISFISLNDRPIYIDESGNFTEKLLLYPGYNIIKLQARDKFGASVEK